MRDVADQPLSRTHARRRAVALLALLAVVALAVYAIGGGGAGQPSPAGQPGAATGPAARAAAGAGPRAAPALALGGIPIGRWVTLAPSPHSRAEVSAARVGDVAYVVGGFDTSGRTTALVERLDLRSGRWSTSRPLPLPLNHMSAVAYGGSLYVVGGYSQPTDTSTGAVRDFWRFDPTSDRWTAMPAAPLPRAAAGAAVLGHRLYVAGGRSDTQTTISTLAIFDFDTGRWSLGPPLLHPREHLAGVAAGGSVWMLGGRALGQGNFTYVERYRPGSASWQEMPAMPIARSSFQAVAATGRIVTVGGEGATTFAEVDALDPASGRWTRLADLPTPRHGLGLVADGPLVFAIDGGPQPGLTGSSVVSRLRVG
jgi:Kelch motif protein/galactose oxidase-like protein